MDKKFVSNLNKYILAIFQVAFFAYLVYFLVDLWRPGLISYYINLNAILLIWLVSGLAYLIFAHIEKISYDE